MNEFNQCECGKPKIIMKELLLKRVLLTGKTEYYYYEPAYYVLVLMYLLCEECGQFQYGIHIYHWSYRQVKESLHKRTIVEWHPVIPYGGNEKHEAHYQSLKIEALGKYSNVIKNQIEKHQEMPKDKSE